MPLKFRWLVDVHGLARKVFEIIKTHLAERGLMMRAGSIVDVNLIAAPPSTKNRQGA